MKKNLFVALLLIQCFNACAQSILTGIVIDDEDKKPVPYVSIGVTRTPNGTVSNIAGEFKITLNDLVTDNDTLKFSSIGYQSEAFLIGDLKKRIQTGALNIILKKAVSQLEQVSIISKKGQSKIVGYDKNSRLLGVGFDASGLGAQAGVIIPISHPGTNLQNLSFLVIQNPYQHLVFRMNLYDMVKDKPGNIILTENIIINVDDYQTGKLTFDLSKYNLYFNKDVLLTLEWLVAEPATKSKLVIAAAMFGRTYFREASQSEWSKKGTGLGLSVKTVY